jgi:hypothetical protein
MSNEKVENLFQQEKIAADIQNLQELENKFLEDEREKEAEEREQLNRLMEKYGVDNG